MGPLMETLVQVHCHSAIVGVSAGSECAPKSLLQETVYGMVSAYCGAAGTNNAMRVKKCICSSARGFVTRVVVIEIVCGAL